MRTITILNLKGGTAKTTTCRNMGTILATTYGKRVLLCDIDESGNLSSSFDMRPHEGDGECITRLLRDRTADPHDYIRHTNIENLDIITCNETISDCEAEIKGDSANIWQWRLKRHLAKVRDEYDFCIFDCSPRGTPATYNALACSQEVIVPTTVDQDSLDAAARTIVLIHRVLEEDLNPALELRGLLFTRIANNSVDKEGVNMQLPRGLVKFNTYIRESVEVRRCRLTGLSPREYVKKYRRKKFAPLLDYNNFVAEYLGVELPHPREPYCLENVQVEHFN